MKSLLLAASFLCLCGPQAIAQYHIIVNDGGTNCVTAKGESGYRAFAWSVGARENLASPNAGISSGKPSFQDLSVAGFVDACNSPLLQRNFLGGTLFRTVTLSQYQNTSGNLLEVVTLTNAVLSSYSIDGSTDSDFASENVSFTYQKICFKDFTYSPTGTQASTQACYDIATAKETPLILHRSSKIVSSAPVSQ